jgi:hypothetical protein
VAPALPLKQLLQQGREIGPKLRERPRNRPHQMQQLVNLIQHTHN